VRGCCGRGLYWLCHPSCESPAAWLSRTSGCTFSLCTTPQGNTAAAVVLVRQGLLCGARFPLSVMQQHPVGRQSTQLLLGVTCCRPPGCADSTCSVSRTKHAAVVVTRQQGSHMHTSVTLANIGTPNKHVCTMLAVLCCRGHACAFPPTGSSSSSGTAPQLPAAHRFRVVHDQPRVRAAPAAGIGTAVWAVLGCSQRLLYIQVVQGRQADSVGREAE
jgi:hypothetical protein